MGKGGCVIYDDDYDKYDQRCSGKVFLVEISIASGATVFIVCVALACHRRRMLRKELARRDSQRMPSPVSEGPKEREADEHPSLRTAGETNDLPVLLQPRCEQNVFIPWRISERRAEVMAYLKRLVAAVCFPPSQMG